MAKDNQVERGSTGLAVKAGAWYVASTFLLKSIAFITIPIFSRLLSKSDYGEFGNYANWQAMLVILTGAELYNSLSRAYYDYKEDYDRFVSSVTMLTFFFTAAFYVLFLLSGSWIYRVVKIPPQFVHILFFTLFCSACKTLFMARERTLYRYKSVAAISAIDTVIPTAIAVVLVMLAPESSRLGARIYGFYLPSAMVGLFCAGLMLLRGRTFKAEHCKYALMLSIPLLLHYLTISLLTSTNTIITKNIGGAELSAEVSMATSVLHILTMLFTSLSGALTTWLMDNLEQKQEDKVRRESLVYLLGLAVVSIGVILIAPEVLAILGGSQYASAVVLIPGMVFAAFLQTVTTIFTIILTYDKNVVKTAVFSGIMAVASVAAKVFLFPYYGVMCLPAVNIVVCAALFFINYLLVCHAGYRRAIDLRKYALATGFVLLFMVFSAFLYSHNIIRWTLILIGIAGLLVVTCLFRDKLRTALKKNKKQKADA